MFVRCASAAAALLLVAGAAIPQDLAPEVLLLSRIKRHLRDELAHVPNYTCLETISRFRNDPESGPKSYKGLQKLDTIQLEVVYTDNKEWYGSPGAKSLSVDDPLAFIGGGMIGTGAFALSMHNLVEAGIFTYRGHDRLNGRDTVKYDYRVPVLYRPLLLTLQGASGAAGDAGSIWTDPESLDVVHLESRAADIPPYLPVREATMKVDYARMRIAGSDTLLAQDSDTTLDLDTGLENYNHLEFTHCRSYSASSEISFGSGPGEPATGSSAPAAPGGGTPIPPSLDVTIVLTTPVSDKDAVGKIVEAKTDGDVVRKGKVVVPAGSVVHGRVRTLEHLPDRGVYAVGLEFSEIDINGQSLAFYGDFLRIDKDPRIERSVSRRTMMRDGGPVDAQLQPDSKRTPLGEGRSVAGAAETITLPDLWGVAQVFVKGANFTLPAGFRTYWRTRGFTRGVDR